LLHRNPGWLTSAVRAGEFETHPYGVSGVERGCGLATLDDRPHQHPRVVARHEPA